MSKMREAADKHIGDVDAPYKDQAFDDFCDGWKAAIAAVKEGGEVAWQNTRNGFICKEQSAEYQHPLYKLPEN